MLLSGEEVEIVVEFVAIGEALEGSITFPGHEPRVLSNVGFDSRGVHFEISEGGRVIVAYDGELAGDTISGDALEGRESAPFTLKRVEPRAVAKVLEADTPVPTASPTATPPPEDCSGFSGAASTPAAVAGRAPIGMNIDYVRDWNPAIPFVNVFRAARPWIAREFGVFDVYASGIEVPLDAQGYPFEIPYDNGVDPPQIVHTLMLWATNWDYPRGTYTLIFDGDGEIQVTGDVPDLFFVGGGLCHRFTVRNPNPEQGLALIIERSNKDDPVRNIRVILPGFETVYEVQPFHPTYLERLRGFSVIRFMGWAETNFHEVVGWDARTAPDYALQSRPLRGAAYEYMVQLSNGLEADPWFTIPHFADDNYVAELARLIKRDLNPDLKVYIEYSNEVWNYTYDQTDWVNEQGVALGLAPEAGMAGWRYTAKRSAEIFKIFEDEFGAEKKRLVKVLASQAANPTVSEQILEAFSQASINGVDVNPWGIEADALAIAPYFGGDIADEIFTNGEVRTITIDEILNRAEQSISQSVEWVRQSKAVADRYNLPLIAYEGGQHLVATREGVENDALTEKLVAANAHPRMYDLYRKYLDAWFDNGGGLFASFSYVKSPGKHGSWGVLLNQDQPIAEAPKYRALVDAIQQFLPEPLYTPSPIAVAIATQTPTQTSDEAVELTAATVPEECSGSSASPATSVPAAGRAPIGMNLEGMAFSAPSTPFVDVFKKALVWIPQDIAPGGLYNSGVEIALDAQGYPVEIPYDNGVDLPQRVSTLMLYNTGWEYPGGTYTVVFDGDGEIEVGLDVFPDRRFVGEGICHNFTLTTPSPNSGFYLNILRSNKDNPLRNIRVILPGFETVYEEQPFHPTYLGRLRGFSVVRFMDWGNTNNSTLERWEERATTDYGIQTRPEKGVAYEYMIQLSNELDADPWFTIPHLADDNYVAELARLIRRDLDPDLKVYIEYSNEVWNWTFDQKPWAVDQGLALGLADESDLAGSRYTAKRSAEIFKIFEDEFGAEKDRLVNVLASQAASSGVAEQILEAFSQSSINGVDVNPWGIEADALAIAPYFGGEIGDEIIASGEVGTITVDEILVSADQSISQSEEWIRANKAVADRYNVSLIAYEGGQHLVGTGENIHFDTLTQKLVAANDHPRMYDLYRKYLDAWFDNGGELFVAFAYFRRPDRYGSWGVLRHQDQPIEEAPKYRALVDTIQEFLDGTRTQE